ncbi:unnamed protein product [Leptidea sinapis]|uniref:Uncharacterized protein n=1 Tax=Leptidea sinapis TaxID=189913 RepID=A0A5E4QS77_9NEOP|nr:unnamed protein product [Leptidea sinapis]
MEVIMQQNVKMCKRTLRVRVALTVSSESCFQQRCLACHPQETFYAGSSTECVPSNWVSAQWVHNLGHPPPSTESKLNIEMRGCVPRAQVDSVCLGLVAVERARGHSDARCFICNGNDCNSAIRLGSISPFVFIILYTLSYVLR